MSLNLIRSAAGFALLAALAAGCAAGAAHSSGVPHKPAPAAKATQAAAPATAKAPASQHRATPVMPPATTPAAVPFNRAPARAPARAAVNRAAAGHGTPARQPDPAGQWRRSGRRQQRRPGRRRRQHLAPRSGVRQVAAPGGQPICPGLGRDRPDTAGDPGNAPWRSPPGPHPDRGTRDDR